MTPLQTLSKIIIEAIPEILDLKFGCQLYNSEYGIEIINDVRTTGNGSIKKYFTDKSHSFYSDTIVNNKILRNLEDVYCYEIIGRPITLEDVIYVLAKKYGEWSITAWGNGVIRIDKGIDWKEGNLADQIPQTINSLLEILR